MWFSNILRAGLLAPLIALAVPALAQTAAQVADAPILPGVAQIDWAILFARELFAMPTQFAGLEAIKFHDWIGAGASVTLSLQRSADDVVAFRIGSDKGAHASGRILFRDPQ